MTPLPSSVPDTSLGLSASEVRLLRHHQQLAFTNGGAGASSRGRGIARSSAESSRAASAASSGGAGRLVLDPGSLAVLGAHFERLMARIQERVDYLTAQTTISTTAQGRSAASAAAAADAEIARFRDLLRQIDELETEFDKVRHIRDIVKGYRARVEGIGKSLNRRR